MLSSVYFILIDIRLDDHEPRIYACMFNENLVYLNSIPVTTNGTSES
jgi:hypothetical protein